VGPSKTELITADQGITEDNCISVLFLLEPKTTINRK